jgi:hypothetical protein
MHMLVAYCQIFRHMTLGNLEDWRRQTKISTSRVGELGILSQLALEISNEAPGKNI